MILFRMPCIMPSLHQYLLQVQSELDKNIKEKPVCPAEVSGKPGKRKRATKTTKVFYFISAIYSGCIQWS